MDTYNYTYKLKHKEKNAKVSLRGLYTYIRPDRLKLIAAFVCIITTSASNTLSPFLIAHAVDAYIKVGNVQGLLHTVYILIGVFILTLVAGYMQSRLIGGVSQRTLYRLREALFSKLQDLPIAFFNQNKVGDLMSRINNDTDKINKFLSEGIGQFIGVFFSLLGIVYFTMTMHVRLALVMMSITIFLYIVTKLLSLWIRKENTKNLEAVGDFSAALQENLTNFRVVVAYGKRDYVQDHLEKANQATFKTALTAGVGNRIFEPIYDFGGSLALIVVLSYGFYLISHDHITVGILIAFVAYTQKFYDPMRMLATMFGSIQLATAAWGRLQEVFGLENNLTHISTETIATKDTAIRLELDDVSFAYEGGVSVIEHASLAFKPACTYALVGPTGGGKSTLASLMAHLYDPTSGIIYLNGKDIRSYSHQEISEQISVILQDPILFTGTVADNITYSNPKLSKLSHEELQQILIEKGFADIMERFDRGLETSISQNGSGLSIGQKQLISFMRAILREPKLLILDEATANIDTVTEVMLGKTLEKLPQDTTKIIIAHRLNTIKEADEIMFVNGRHVTPAGSYEHAISLIAEAKRKS